MLPASAGGITFSGKGTDGALQVLDRFNRRLEVSRVGAFVTKILMRAYRALYATQRSACHAAYRIGRPLQDLTYPIYPDAAKRRFNQAAREP